MTDTAVSESGLTRPGNAGAVPQLPLAEPKDYIACMKPRVMTLVVFTALVGLIAAPGSVHPVLAAASIVLIAIGAGASAALNMWWDADIDKIMARTAARPTAGGNVTRQEALTLGLVLSVFSTVLLGLVAGVTAAAILGITIAFYALVYTMWLKRRTDQNIVIGGAAGAFPPMIGWAVVTDSVTLSSISLFLIIFFWTPAHFWALSLFVNTDYQKAGVPMLTVTSPRQSVARQVCLYAVMTALISVAPVALGFAGWIYGIAAVGLGLRFVQWSVRVLKGMKDADRGMFLYSITYLFALFGALAADVLITEWVL